MTDYIVLRALGERVDGMWFNRAEFTVGHPVDLMGVPFVNTGEFEVRDDGAVAEVWIPWPENRDGMLGMA